MFWCNKLATIHNLSDNSFMRSREDIKRIVTEQNIKTICLQFSDLHGKLKTISVPAVQIDEIFAGEIDIDGSAIGGYRLNETSDLKLCPDLDTFLVFPFECNALKNTARFICDIKNQDGSVFEGCTRSNLKRVINNGLAVDLQMQIGPEVEFFLFKTDEYNNIISGYDEKSGYYDLNTNDKYDETVFEVMYELQKMGYEVDALHHETAPFQHEIDLGYDDILKTADNLATFKYVTRIIADNYGFKASFMPKPIFGQNGSGLHLNMSITDPSGNIFYDKKAKYELSNNALYSIGSILKNIKGITALLNPTVNSYKRLVRDYEAPIYIAWSVVSRSALVRVPSSRGESTRLELRSPDAGCNPYLAFAVILQTCLDGIKYRVEPHEPIEKNLFLLSGNEIKQRKIKSLPRNMFTALEEMEKSLVTKAALGDYIFDEFLYTKRLEWNDYRKQVTPWELQKYLDI